MHRDQHWAALAQHHALVADRSILGLFDANPSRAEDFSVTLPTKCDAHLPVVFDYSKTNIDETGRALLVALAKSRGLSQAIENMFQGRRINETEDRAVLHTMLRGLPDPALPRAWVEDHLNTRARLYSFAEEVRMGLFQGPSGPFTDVLNIGIGGSDLGPAMATIALSPYRDGPRVHCLSNVDGAHAADILAGLDPRRTLVIIASKTFTTQETMANAQTVLAWMKPHVADPAAQLVAVSTAKDKAAEWGIPPERVFGFGDFIGGRYSVWSPVGLSLALAIGPKRFEEFLAGAAEMDCHFRKAPFEQNMPVMLALTGIWHNQLCGYTTRAVLPYDQRLARLPAYLQQLEMESNGKSVAMDGSTLGYHSGPVVWGEPGTNGQHAFYQLIHQGTRIVPCEFLIAARGHEPELHHQQTLLIANCLAQSKALLHGRTLEAARKMMESKGLFGTELERQANHRVFPGNRPSTTLAYEKLTPAMLGRILALYEHRVFAEGVILGINSFDQWGVELGKELALALMPVLQGTPGEHFEAKDSSTRMLVNFLRQG